MRPGRFRLWPRSLAGRLVLVLVATLAAAQLLLVLLLHSQQDAVIERIIRGETLSRAVTLARLLDTAPAVEGERIARAFVSRDACARLGTAPPPPYEMTAVERSLADLLGRMLHGVRAGRPEVMIDPHGQRAGPCGEETNPWAAPDGPRTGHGPAPPSAARHRLAAVSTTVPLADGRWLSVRSAVPLPRGWNRTTLVSFLISALAVALVTIAYVRMQTRSLRALADASDRFGRGEAVPPLSVAGPSEVAAATRAFNTMQERLSRFIHDRLRLLAAVSHDLRTPLTTLRLKAEFIDDDAVREDMVATIDELAAICEATLAFTRAEAAAEDTARVDARELCTELAEEFALAGAEVAVAAGPPAMVACRPVALKRALRNLVENAVRYGTRARLETGRDAHGGITVAVDDDGPGLPADRVEDAFQPFVRLEASRSSETGGIGLGLAIARSIVRAHGGSITLANRAEGGLRVEVHLPAGPDAGPRGSSVERSGSRFAQRQCAGPET